MHSGPPATSAGDLAYELEVIGVGLDDFERVLQLVDQVTPGTPGSDCLYDASATHRIVAVLETDERHFGGDRLGVYRGCMFLAWRKVESDFHFERSGRRRR